MLSNLPWKLWPTYKGKPYKDFTKQSKLHRQPDKRESWCVVFSRQKIYIDIACKQEIIKVREWIPHKSPLTKVIPLKLFLDIVPSSSEDVTRAMRGQPKRLSQSYRGRNGGNVNVYVLISFHSRYVPCTLKRFLFLCRPFVCFVFIWLLIFWPLIYSISGLVHPSHFCRVECNWDNR